MKPRNRLARVLKPLIWLALALPFATVPAVGMGLDSGGDTAVTNGICVPDENPVIQPGPLGGPMRLIPGPDSDYLVADYRKGAIVSVTPQTLDAPLLLAETRGLPLSLARITQKGQPCVLVGNDTDRTIDFYSVNKTKANCKQQWFKKEGIQALDMDVAPTAQRLYVVDGQQGTVRVLDYAGKPATVAGGFPGLITPKGIAVDESRGIVIVTDYGDPLIGDAAFFIIFTLDGTALKTVTGSTGGFSRPQGVATLGGRIFVADATRGQVLEFHQDSAGLIASYGCFGTSPGHLLLPMDVVVDGPGQALYVADTRNGRITMLPLSP